MKMVLHILSKDIRGLRWEILATVALTLATSLFEWPSQHGTLKDLGQFWSQPATVLAWILLVLRVVQRDGLVGTEPDWLTRPVRRWQVVLAKVLFVGLFVVTPMAIRDAIVVSANGFPVRGYLAGLGWSLAVWIGVFLLPAAAIGVVTRTIPQALMGVLGLVAVFGLTDIHGVDWLGVGWVPMGMAALIGAVAAALVLWVQYGWRWAVGARVLGVVGVVAAVIVLMVLPWKAAFFFQRFFASEEVDASKLEVRLGATMMLTKRQWQTKDGHVPVNFPIVVSGAPAGYRVRVLRAEALPDPDWEMVDGGLRRDSSHPDGMVYGLGLRMRVTQWGKEEEQPVRFRGRVYVAVLAPRAKQEFTFENGRQMVPGVGVCAASFDRIPVFYCRTPFRTPTETRVTLWGTEPQQGSVMTVLSSLSSLSPLPFEFSLAPMRGVAAGIERLDYSGELTTAAGLAGGRITYETWAPVAYIEREFEVTGQRLGDYLGR